MSQSLVPIYVHVVFSSKHRVPFLKEKDFRDRAHRYLAGICKKCGLEIDERDAWD